MINTQTMVETPELETSINDTQNNDENTIVEIVNHLPNGKFAPGNRASKGRPPRQVELSNLVALKRAVRSNDIEAIGKKVLNQALEQSHFPSQKLLLEILVPREIQILQLKENQIFMLASIFTRFKLAGVEVSEVLNSLNEQSLRLLNEQND